MFAAEALGHLPAIAKIAQRIAELEDLFALDPGVACRTGAREHALPYPRLQLFLQLRGRRREQQNTHARAPVGCLFRGEFEIDPRLTPAADHGCCKARHGDGRLPCPARRIGSDRQRGRAHAKGFRERIVDPHPFDCQDAHGTNSNGSGRPSAYSGT